MKEPADISGALDLSLLTLKPEEIQEAQRRMLIIERVLTAPARGNVVIELSKDTFEEFARAGNPDKELEVVWGTDATGFSAPVITVVARETEPAPLHPVEPT